MTILSRLVVVAVLLSSGCAAVRDAVTEDRSTWTQEMRDDVDRCEEEVVAGSWGWGRPTHDGWTRSFSDARRRCLRERGWRL
jgi:hypothetical protein